MSDALAIKASNQLAWTASVVSIVLLILAAGIYFFIANRRVIGWLHLTPTTIQPAWLMPATLYDNGSALRMLSILCLIGSCLALVIAILLQWLWRTERQRIQMPQITIQAVLLLFLFIAIGIVISRPPISEEFERAWSLSMLGFVSTLVLAFYPPTRSRRL